MTQYVNMHGSNRLTVKQMEALLEVLGVALSTLEDQLEDGEGGVMDRPAFLAAEAARTKLTDALRLARAKGMAYCDRCAEDKPGVQRVRLRDHREAEYDLCRDCRGVA